MNEVKQHIPVRLIYIVLILFLSFSNGSAQSIEEVLRNFERGDLESVKQDLPNLEARYGERPEYLFLKAVFEEDGDRAFTLYSELNDVAQDNPIYEKALWRMCQYNYAKGLYLSCGEMLDRFMRRFQDSDYLDKAVQMRSRISDFLGEDNSVPDPVIEEAKPVFTVQVGAFRSRSNAERRLTYLRKLGLVRAYITETTVTGTTLYKIWVGEYSTRESAHESGREIRQRYRLSSYTIVEKK